MQISDTSLKPFDKGRSLSDSPVKSFDKGNLLSDSPLKFLDKLSLLSDRRVLKQRIIKKKDKNYRI